MTARTPPIRKPWTAPALTRLSGAAARNSIDPVTGDGGDTKTS